MPRTTPLVACALVLLVGTHLTTGDASARPPNQMAPNQATSDQMTSNGGPDQIEGRYYSDEAKTMRADPGWYQSVVKPSEHASYYRVSRALEESDVTVGLLSRPTGDEGQGHYLRLTLETEGGAVCDKTRTWKTENPAPRLAQLTSVSSSAPGQSAKAQRKCARENRFVLVLGGSVNKADMDVDFLVREEPLAENVAELPIGASPPHWKAPSLPNDESAANEPARATVDGATHPLRAEPLEPGAYETTISSGEQLYFRVDADWGQAVRARVTAGSPTTSTGRGQVESGGQYVAGQLVGPSFGTALIAGKKSMRLRQRKLSLDSSARLRLHSAPVRYRNRTAEGFPAVRQASTPGPYFLVVTMSDSGANYDLPIRFELTAEGEPEPGPVYQDRAQPVGPLWPVEEDRTVAWSLLGGGLLLFVVGVATLIAARRRTVQAPAPVHPFSQPA